MDHDDARAIVHAICLLAATVRLAAINSNAIAPFYSAAIEEEASWMERHVMSSRKDR